jgi:acetyl esterase
MRFHLLSLALLPAALAAAPAYAEESCAGIAPQPTTLAGATSHVYRIASGRALRLHAFGEAGTVDNPRPAILFFFGGGWRTGEIEALRPQAEAFAARGYVALLADYRVACRDGTTALGATDDALAAHAWLRSHAEKLGIDPARIVLSGGSAGGQLALAAAMKAPAPEKPAALVLFNPAVDLVGPANWLQKPLAHAISPSTLPVAGLPPTIIFHGQSDAKVPIKSVRNFCTRAARAGSDCRLIEYRKLGHGFYHDQRSDAGIGHSPYSDTLTRAETFLSQHGLP